MGQSESVTVRVGDFLPSRHGFRFDNSFPSGPVVSLGLPGLSLPIGDASNGLCGGMSFAVRDFFELQQSIPGRDTPPACGSELFNYLVCRLWDSFCLPGGPFRYYAWMGMSDERILKKTLREGWPRVRGELDRGRLAPLGFNRYRSRNPLRLGDNHQVLSYGYDWNPDSGRVVLHLYDPNYALADDVTFTFHVRGPEAAAGIVCSKGDIVRGFFHTPYRPPGFAWLGSLLGLQ
jgi:hypothetical protein